jgi:hypothetical protein
VCSSDLFYSIGEGMMSHIFSFFLMALLLFLLKKFFEEEKKKYGVFILISVVISLMTLIRPTNIIMLVFFAVLDVTSFKEIRDRVLFFLRPKYSLAFAGILFLVFLPQLFYWKYLTGSFVYYSYGEEGFINRYHPMLIPMWFAPLNGLFLYNPILLFFIAGMIIMLVKKIPNGIFIAAMFLFISYLFSSWHSWYYGGSYGSRPFVDFYPLFGLAFGYLLKYLSQVKNLFTRSGLILLLVACTYYNLRLVNAYDWFYSSTWSWDDYRIQLDRAGLYSYDRKTYTYVNDFENRIIDPGFAASRNIYHSATIAAIVDGTMENSLKYERTLGEILDHKVSKIDASLWVFPGHRLSTGAFFICSITDVGKEVRYYRELPVDRFLVKPYSWNEISAEWIIPRYADPTWTISFYIWNPAHTTFYVDDMKLKFE